MGHLKLKGSSLRFLNDPNQSALVFDGFSLRPDRFPKELRTVIARLTELQSLHKRVVSLANWLSYYDLVKTGISFIVLSCLILNAKISTPTINK